MGTGRRSRPDHTTALLCTRGQDLSSLGPIYTGGLGWITQLQGPRTLLGAGACLGWRAHFPSGQV